MTKKELLKLVNKELENRKLKKVRKLSGLYLMDSQALRIAHRQQKAIVSSAYHGKYIGKPVYICGKYIYGIIILNRPLKINQSQFVRLQDKHMVTEDIRLKQWPDVNELYYYNFRIVKIYKEPKSYRLERDSQGFIEEIKLNHTLRLFKARASEITPESLSKLDDAKLLQMHRTIHLLYRRARRRDARSFELYVNAHVFIVEELKKRGLKHQPIGDGLDELSKPFESKGFRKAIINDFNQVGDIVIDDKYVSIIGSSVDGQVEPNDVDVLIRQGKRDKKLEEKIRNALKDKYVKSRIHFSYIPMGSHGSHIPIYRLKLEKIIPFKMEKGIVDDIYLESFKALVPDSCVYLSIEKLLAKICDKNAKLNARYWVEPEFAGERIIVHKTGEKIQLRNQVGENITTSKSGLKSILKKQFDIPGDFIVDGILLRNDKFIITDLLARESSQLYKDPLFNRKFFMTKLDIKDGLDVYLVNTRYVRTKQELLDAINYFGDIGYRSLLVKLSASTYSLDGKTSCWHRVHLGKDKALKPFRVIEPLKPGRAYHHLEMLDIDEAWEKWAQGFIKRDIAVSCEIKYDGFRTIGESDGSKTLIYFEDAKEDRSKIMPSLSSELKNLGDIIIDGELVEIKDGKQIPRRDMIRWATSKEKLDDSGLILNVFDLLYYQGNDLTKKTWEERQEILKKAVENSKHIKRVVPIIAKTKEEFYSAVKKQMGKTYSEGAVCKAINSLYELDGSTSAWCKIKTMKELHVLILEKVEVK